MFATVTNAVSLVLSNPPLAFVIGLTVSAILKSAAHQRTLSVQEDGRVVEVLVHAQPVLYDCILLVLSLCTTILLFVRSLNTSDVGIVLVPSPFGE